jgi:putative colanic acid biosynthesis glycosyltransferase
LYDAMNRGIDAARGDYLLFLNAGDELADTSVLEAVASTVASRPAPDFIYGDAIDVTPDQGKLYKAARSYKTLWWTMFACHQSMFFRRERIGGLRYRLAYRHAADYAFVAEFLRESQTQDRAIVRQLRAPLCRFWLGGNSWQNRRLAIREDFRIRRDHIRMPLPLNAALFLAHQLHTTLKRRIPWVTQRVRYRGRRHAPTTRDAG